MTSRIAFFLTEPEIENFFEAEITGQSILEPHYNLARGQHVVVILQVGGSRYTERIRLGKERKGMQITNDKPMNIKETLVAGRRCIIPMSGFYIWKENNGGDQPFFVRMMNNEPMAVCGMIFEPGSKNEYCEIIEQEANPLIQPMTHKMPVLFDKPLMEKWLSGEGEAEAILKKAKSRFLITDITVHRVTKKVNDLSENEPELIQPIPK